LIEGESSQLDRESQQKLNQSEMDLAIANDILNRTNRVQQKAQDQLLTLECKLPVLLYESFSHVKHCRSFLSVKQILAFSLLL